MATHDDPEEIDISQHHYVPASKRVPTERNDLPPGPNQIDDNALRQMMLGMDPSAAYNPPPPGTNPFAGLPGMGGMPGTEGMGGLGADDPMMNMLQQIMGGMGDGGIPSFPGMPGMQGQASAAPDPYAAVWRVVHAVFALSLGLYVAFATAFTGTKIEREKSGLWSRTEQGIADGGLSVANVHFFWMFATGQLILQTSRFFVEKGRIEQSGILGTVAGFLPQPWKGYLGLVSRYSRIWSTVSGDAMVCIFVLGACAWWRGA